MERSCPVCGSALAPMSREQRRDFVRCFPVGAMLVRLGVFCAFCGYHEVELFDGTRLEMQFIAF